MAMLFQDEELDTNNYTNNMIQDIFDFLFWWLDFTRFTD